MNQSYNTIPQLSNMFTVKIVTKNRGDAGGGGRRQARAAAALPPNMIEITSVIIVLSVMFSAKQLFYNRCSICIT